MEKEIVCPHCGKPVDSNAPYCMFCGKGLQPKFKESGNGHLKKGDHPFSIQGIRWIWFLIFFGIIMVLVFIQSFILAYIYKVPLNSPEGIPQWATNVSLTVTIFIGSMITALISPGKTLLEPPIAASIFVILSLLYVGDVPGILFGWIMPFIISWLGANLGEYVSDHIIRHPKKLISN